MLRICLVTLTLLATTTLAQQPKPSPRLAGLNAFTGTWRCTGTAFASPWGPEHPTAAKIRVAWVLGGFWLEADYAEQKTAKNPNAAAGRVYWGHDDQKKKLSGFAVNNHGGSVSIESDGWSGDTIVWNGTMSLAGMTIPTRDTFVRKSAREIAHKTEAEMNGQWVQLTGETCRKK